MARKRNHDEPYGNGVHEQEEQMEREAQVAQLGEKKEVAAAEAEEPKPPAKLSDGWSDERKAKAKELGEKAIALYKLLNPRLVSILSTKVSAVENGLAEPIIELQMRGIELEFPIKEEAEANA